MFIVKFFNMYKMFIANIYGTMYKISTLTYTMYKFVPLHIHCTGLYPYKLGRQHESLPPMMPTGLSTKFKLLPQFLKVNKTL